MTASDAIDVIQHLKIVENNNDSLHLTYCFRLQNSLLARTGNEMRRAIIILNDSHVIKS